MSDIGDCKVHEDKVLSPVGSAAAEDHSMNLLNLANGVHDLAGSVVNTIDPRVRNGADALANGVNQGATQIGDTLRQYLPDLSIFASGSTNGACTEGAGAAAKPQPFTDNAAVQSPKGGDSHVTLSDKSTNVPAAIPFERDATRPNDALRSLFRIEHGRLQGSMTLAEINRLMQSPNLTDDQAIALAAIRSGFDGVRSLDPGQAGITCTAIFRLAEAWQRHIQGQRIPQAQTDLITALQASASAHRCYLESSNRSLYATANPRDSVVTDGCSQGVGIGNCHFVSAMTALARTNPQAIIDMITDNNNGTYTVKFPNYNPITVNRPTNAELAYYGTGNSHGLWSTVLQMAYGRLWSPDDTANPAIEGAGGSIRSDGLRKLTGAEVTTTHTGKFTGWSTLHTNLERANTEPTTATVFVEVREIFGYSPSTGFPGSHEYAIVNFVPNREDPRSARVTVQNPHRSMTWPATGVPAGMIDRGGGRVEMSLEQFNGIFYNFRTATPRRILPSVIFAA